MKNLPSRPTKGDLLGDGEDLIDYYLRCTDNLFSLSGESKEFGNLYELYQVADLFMSQYGMGGCRSIEEYVAMVNQTDPVAVNMLRTAMLERLKQQNSAEPVQPRTYAPLEEETSPEYKPVFTYIPPPPSKADLKANRHNMAMFLREWGADTGEIKATLSELDDRKMTLTDYSWVDRHSLEAMPQEKFKELLKQMGEERIKSKNFVVSLNTMAQKASKER